MVNIKALSISFFFVACSVQGGAARQTEPDIDKNCAETGYITAVEGDDCGSLAELAGITREQIQKLNPALARDCSNVHADWDYCIAVREPGTTPTKPPTEPTPTPTTNPDSGIIGQKPSGITDSGQPSSCNAWYKIVDKDTCSSILTKLSPQLKQFGFSSGHLLGWNPALNPDCSGLKVGSHLCVGANVPVPTVEPVNDGGPSGGDVVTTKPSSGTLDGQPNTCRGWYKVKGGNTCTTVLDTLKGVKELTRGHLLGWNPTIGPDCGGLKEGTFLCVQAAIPSGGKR